MFGFSACRTRGYRAERKGSLTITINFSFDDARGASFSHAHMTVIMANQSMGLLRTEFIAAKLTSADFTGAGLGHVTFRYAKMVGVHFSVTDLRNAEFEAPT